MRGLNFSPARYRSFYKMRAGQSKISSFFSTESSCKRKLEKNTDDQSTSNKLQKCEESTEEDNYENERSAGTIGLSWRNALVEEFNKEYFKKLMVFIASERKSHTIYPKEEDVYSWTKHCTIDEVKVVIIGQDPYHQPKQAHGLCFSVPVGVTPPPSLVNIYKELKDDIEGFTIPDHGNLTGWAEQGVLLLNACLTVRAGQANSHKDKGWEKFTDAVIRWINQNRKSVVFLLWGSYAQKKGAFIDKKKHCVLKCVHPSPLSAYRGFFGCKHFSKTNEYLKETKQEIINWKLLLV